MNDGYAALRAFLFFERVCHCVCILYEEDWFLDSDM